MSVQLNRREQWQLHKRDFIYGFHIPVYVSLLLVARKVGMMLTLYNF